MICIARLIKRYCHRCTRRTHICIELRPRSRQKVYRALIVTTLGILLLIHFGVFDILMGTSFSQFKYPLNIDLVSVVKAVKQHREIDVKPINAYSFSHVIENSERCHDDENEDVFLLAVIKSSIEHFENRMAIRETWGGRGVVQGRELRSVFLLGVRPLDGKHLQNKVIAENQLYGDLLQDDFHDQYFNNTLKTMMGFRWATIHCRNAKFIFFVDDDYYVSIQSLVEYLLSIGDKKRFLAGYVFTTSLPKRNPYSKWYISREEYPFFFYPSYPTAGAYVVSMDVAVDFDIGFRYTKYLRFDDVFLGIVAWKLLVTPVHHSEFYFLSKVYPMYNRRMIASHGYSDGNELRDVWWRSRMI
ncbi:beta-1,3-galactosyltransferase brn-like [Lineus longissimus]|uniref:beta-1,3-galactosyltransferase brn-like n=1 Tax=Lineus longissimus TaxID=88925 RepID=UPI00315D9662